MSGSKADEPSKGQGSESSEPEQTPKLDAAVQGALGRKLRESYEEVVREEVPSRFLNLLDELKKKERDGKGSKS
jgi:anti-sigma factor NepR-like protein